MDNSLPFVLADRCVTCNAILYTEDELFKSVCTNCDQPYVLGQSCSTCGLDLVNGECPEAEFHMEVTK